MKKTFLLLLALVLTTAAFADDYDLYVEASTTTSYPLKTVQKITFENGNVVVNKKDGTKAEASISSVSRMYFAVSTTTYVPEDVNRSGAVDTQDVLKVYDFMKAGSTVTSDTPEDVNSSGAVDTQDVLKIYDYMKSH